MSQRKLIYEIAKIADISQNKAAVILEITINTMAEHVSQSTGEGIDIKEFGRFHFKEYENFGSVNVATGERTFSGVLLRYVRKLRFSPDRSLARLLQENELNVRFCPIEEFDSDDFTGELRLPQSGN